MRSEVSLRSRCVALCCEERPFRSVQYPLIFSAFCHQELYAAFNLRQAAKGGGVRKSEPRWDSCKSQTNGST